MRTRSNRGRLLGLLATIGALMAGCTPTVNDATVTRLSVQDVVRRLESGGVLVVDTRPVEQYEAGRIPGSRNVRLPDVRIGVKTPELAPYGTLIVYGQNPGSADAVALAKRLIRGGHSDVRLLEGGFEAWRGAGLPIERR